MAAGGILCILLTAPELKFETEAPGETAACTQEPHVGAYPRGGKRWLGHAAPLQSRTWGNIDRLQKPQKTEAGKAAAARPGTRPQYTWVPGHCSAALEGPGTAAPAVIPGQGWEAARARHWSRLLSVRLGKSVIKFTCSIRAGDEAARR